MGRQHHLVGAGVQQFTFGGHGVAARDDLDLAVEAARAQRDEDIGGVVRQHGGERPRPVDAGILQDGLVGGVALNAEMAGLAGLLDPALALFEHHDLGAAVFQRLGEFDADAAIAADDDVVVQFVDFSLHAATTQ